jgi:hypothetical protein
MGGKARWIKGCSKEMEINDFRFGRITRKGFFRFRKETRSL